MGKLPAPLHSAGLNGPGMEIGEEAQVLLTDAIAFVSFVDTEFPGPPRSENKKDFLVPWTSRTNLAGAEADRSTRDQDRSTRISRSDEAIRRRVLLQRFLQVPHEQPAVQASEIELAVAGLGRGHLRHHVSAGV